MLDLLLTTALTLCREKMSRAPNVYYLVARRYHMNVFCSFSQCTVLLPLLLPAIIFSPIMFHKSFCFLFVSKVTQFFLPFSNPLN